jgi:hypothetical protein
MSKTMLVYVEMLDGPDKRQHLREETATEAAV